MSSAKLLVLLIFAFEIFIFVQGMYHHATFYACMHFNDHDRSY